MHETVEYYRYINLRNLESDTLVYFFMLFLAQYILSYT